MFFFNLCIVGIATFFLCLTAGKLPLRCDEVVAAYTTSWSHFQKGEEGRPPFALAKLDVELFTDLYFAFAIFGYDSAKGAGLTNDYLVRPLNPHDTHELYPELLKLKKRANGKLSLILSIGGGSFNDPLDPYEMGKHTHPLFSRMAGNESARREFIKSCISYAHRYGFDGVDINWEFPGDLLRGGKEEDFDNFLFFLKECKEAFHRAAPPLILSFCLPYTVPYGAPDSYRQRPEKYFEWVAKCASFADRITLMAYDYHTPLSGAITGVNAPLLRDTNPNSDLFIAKSLENYLSHGVPNNKILLGIPLYGWLYSQVSSMAQGEAGPGKPFIREREPSGGSLPYFKITDMIDNKKFSFQIDKITDTAYCYNLDQKQWVSFDTPTTVALKALLAKQNRLKGVVFWAIDFDEYDREPKFPNVRSAIDSLNSKNSQYLLKGRDGNSKHNRRR